MISDAKQDEKSGGVHLLGAEWLPHKGTNGSQMLFIIFAHQSSSNFYSMFIWLRTISKKKKNCQSVTM